MIFDKNSLLGQAVIAMTQNMTGSLGLSFLVILIIAAMFLIGMGVPNEYIYLIVIAVAFVMVLSGVGVAEIIKPIFYVLVLYVSIVFIKNFILNS